MYDELKRICMAKFGFKTDDEYFGNLSIYLDNLLAPTEMLDNIFDYIQTRDLNVLTIESENKIARDMFGGYKYGN